MASTSLTFTLEGRDRLSKVLDKAGDSAKGLEKKLALVGTAIPAAAALAPLVAQAGAAAVAVAAFGAAIIPQIGALSDASKAQTKYQEAVAKSGATSEAAISAHVEFEQQIAKMPSASRQAAAGLSTLKNEYSAWSDGLAKDTMPVFTKGLAVASAMLPKLTPLVKGASVELNRFMTTVAGGVNTSAFDRISAKFSDFATGSLKRANDGLVHLLRTFDTGKVGGSLSEFMDYARAQGPLLADTLKNVATAAVHLLTAASGVGVGLLQLANAAAKVVSSLPTGFITTLMQTAIAIRAVRLAGSGIQLLAGGFTAASTAIRAMGTAAIGAGTTMGSLRAAFMALSVSARMMLAATGIGLLAVALFKLSSIGKQAPPNVDRLTTSLGNLARTGKASGEAARAFGSDLGGLADSLRTLARPSNLDKTQQAITSFFGMDSTPVKEAKQNLDAVDKSLASLVQGGKADVAKAAFDRVAAAMRKQGMSSAELRDRLGDYKSAIADAAFEQQVAAQGMGLFGSQALKTQAALAEQQKSADGLRQSIQALNDAQRQGLGGMIGFEASIDAAAKAAKDNAHSLRMVNGELDLNSPKAQAAATALNDLAAKTDDAAAQARQSGKSWEAVNAVYARGRAEFIKSAQAMGLNKEQARQLADQIMKIPNKTTHVKMNAEDATRDLNAFNAKLKGSPGAKSVTLRTLSSTAEAMLESFGYKVTHLKNGSVKITASGGGALSVIAGVAGAIARLHDRHIVLTTENRTIYTGKGGRGPNAATGGLYTGGAFAARYGDGGLVRGPGTGTSDSVRAPWLSAGEFVVKAKSVARYGLDFLRAINTGRLAAGSLGDGGTGTAGMQAARGLAAGMTGGGSLVESAARQMAAAVTTGIKGELQIASPSKKTKALAADVGKGLIVGLTGSQAKIKSVSADLAKDIWSAFTGSKDNKYVAMVNKQTKKLLDDAAKRDKLVSAIATAKKFASDVTNSARENASLGNLGMQPEEVTAGGIKAGLAGKLSQVKQFTKYIDLLSKKGLNKSLLHQILNMGPDAGYAYASALVGADKNTFSSINSMETQLNKSTTTLGQVGADRMYDSGKNAGKGFLKGLEGQQKDIEKLMMSIAKGMQKSIKKALGIKSPSRVMAELGSYSTQGLARGLIEGVPHLDRALGVVTGRMAGTQPVIGRAAGTAAGGGTVYNVNVQIDQAMDPVAVGRELQRVIVQLGRAQGAKVNLNLGGSR